MMSGTSPEWTALSQMDYSRDGYRAGVHGPGRIPWKPRVIYTPRVISATPSIKVIFDTVIQKSIDIYMNLDQWKAFDKYKLLGSFLS